MKPFLIVMISLRMILFGSTSVFAQSSSDFAEGSDTQMNGSLLALVDTYDFVGASPLNYDAICGAIEYPRLAVDAGIEGKVQVRILVNTNGSSVKYKVVSSPDSMLSDAVLKQLPRLLFKPASRGGIATRSWTNISFSFRIDQ